MNKANAINGRSGNMLHPSIDNCLIAKGIEHGKLLP
jgi:hypothetical protein